ncbi:carbohydrate ABC transporter permease [Lachnospiraceae bacterium 50-23]|jgi:raffinose/stachyose/melibiose transport system permease protein|nr:carbohydrate ABC transporter permease [Dorea sp.]
MRRKRYLAGDLAGLLVVSVVFIIPFAFIILNSLKDTREANLLKFSLPETIHFENYMEVFTANDGLFLKSLKNSLIITAGSVVILVCVCSMAGYVMQRRKGKVMAFVNFLVMSGLMIPVAILPTIWVMQRIHLYKTLPGMILLEVAFHTPLSIMLYRGFMANIPVELEEAARIDGCSPLRLYVKIVFPLLKPVTSTIIILNAVTVFNDFMNPLYFLPGSENSTIQLTLYTFMGQFSNSYNMVFADVVLITLPMLILFLIFNQKIVDGMVAGSVKG